MNRFVTIPGYENKFNINIYLSIHCGKIEVIFRVKSILVSCAADQEFVLERSILDLQ